MSAFANTTQSISHHITSHTHTYTHTQKTQRGALAPLLSEPSFPRSAHHLGSGVTCLTALFLSLSLSLSLRADTTTNQIHPAPGEEREEDEKRRGVYGQKAPTTPVGYNGERSIEDIRCGDPKCSPCSPQRRDMTRHLSRTGDEIHTVSETLFFL